MVFDMDSLMGLARAFDEVLSANKAEVNNKDKKDEECAAKEETPLQKQTEEFDLTDDIYVINEDEFLLAKSVFGDVKVADDLELIFSHTNKDDRFVPGVTEEQLLLVLLYKNRNNKERYEQIKKLLNS